MVMDELQPATFDSGSAGEPAELRAGEIEPRKNDSQQR